MWDRFQAEIPKLGGTMRPKKSSDVFSYVEDEAGTHVTVKALCLHLKEKAAAIQSQIFVALEGRVSFDPSSTRKDLRTSDFQTRVAYFKEIEPRRLRHIYGIHFDHDDKLPAHPVFHSQISSIRELAGVVNDRYHRTFEPVAEEDDFVRGLLANVRIPTAHMDVFSVLLQVLGDHFVNEMSDAMIRKSFDLLTSASGTFKSCMTGASRLGAVLDQRCFRASHWYA
ncbi:MAG: hypothetical protein ACHQAQ_04175 [Hyphomicrobiales bacterium]